MAKYDINAYVYYVMDSTSSFCLDPIFPFTYLHSLIQIRILLLKKILMCFKILAFHVA